MEAFVGYQHGGREFSFLVLQPHDKAALLGVNTIKVFLKEFT